ncbi:gamma-aminobutyric acid type B receptor subunit 2-like [Ptychodera flava]|uniref:gamma-aminobutyric acid type B receptor subunit 2-like n=1 Tax=Ptychodera flava TaxID=63121 RepID=UPI00396A9481
MIHVPKNEHNIMSIGRPICIILVTFLMSSLGAEGETGSEKTPLYIGCILPLSGGYWSDIGYESLRWAEAAIADINNNTDILFDYELHLVCNDSQGDISVTLSVVKSQVYDPPQPKLMIFGGVMSTVTIPMSRVLALWHLIQVSPLATAPTLSDRVNFPYFFRTHPSQYVYNTVRLAICRDLGWKNVATLYQNHEKFSVAFDALHESVAQLNMTLLTSESFDMNPAEQLARIKKSDARIIAGAFYQDRALKVFCEAYKLDLYGPKYVWMIPSRWLKQGWWNDAVGMTCTMEELETAIDGMIGMDLNAWDITGRETISGKTASELVTEMDEEDRGYGSLSYDGIWSIAVALNNSLQRFENGEAGYRGDGTQKRLRDFQYTEEIMVEVMKDEVSKVSFYGSSGPVSFNENGERQGIIEIEQNHGGTYRTIGYFNSKTGIIDWRMRPEDIFIKSGGHIPIDFPYTIQVSRIVNISASIFTVMISMATIGLIFCACVLAFNIRHSDKRIIKMSSPNLNNVIIFGCCMMYACVILYGLDHSKYPILCKIDKVLLAIGFTLSFGAMFSKTWRIYKIFTNKKTTKMTIKDQQLFGLVAVLLTVDVVILLLWLLVDPPYVSAQVVNIKREAIDTNGDITRETEDIVYRCYSNNKIQWSFALFAYKGLLLLFGAFLTFQIRNVKIAALNDSRYIALSVYNVVVLSFIGLPVSLMLDDKPQESYAIVSSFLTFCTTTTMILLFGPKIVRVYRGGIVVDSQLQTTHGMNVPSVCTTTQSTCSKCQIMKRELEETKRRLEELQKKGQDRE